MTQDTAIEAWVDRFRDDRDNQYVSEQHVQRAAAIIRLIGTSALDRGFAVPPPDDGDLLRLHREDATWAHIVCATDDGVTYFLRVQEVCAPNAPRRPASSVGADPDEPRWLACRGGGQAARPGAVCMRSSDGRHGSSGGAIPGNGAAA